MTFRALLLAGALAFPCAGQAAVAPVPGAPSSFADLVAHVLPAVVTIDTGDALGSGFVIDQQGDIVTNNHVVAGADSLSVRFQDGTKADAELIGRDPDTDLAVIRVSAKAPIPTVEFGDSDAVRVGDWTVAVGSPYGLRNSVAAGIVSGLHRGLSETYGDYIQTDDPINHGNSGGPLFNMAGQVIGVNAAIISPTQGSAGLSFSIPARLVQHVVLQILARGYATHGWIGARLERESATVAGVRIGSPAAVAGLQAGDTITVVNGKPVTDPHDLAMVAFWSDPGAALTLDVKRGDRLVHLTVTVAESPREGGV